MPGTAWHDTTRHGKILRRDPATTTRKSAKIPFLKQQHDRPASPAL
jgi:hypothetical protein